MLRIIKVTGGSLSPAFQEGDFVLALKSPFGFKSLKQGDVVVFRQPFYGLMIKHVERLSEDGKEIYVLGTHPDSADSRKFGPIRMEDLIGKVIWHIPKKER